MKPESYLIIKPFMNLGTRSKIVSDGGKYEVTTSSLCSLTEPNEAVDYVTVVSLGTTVSISCLVCHIMFASVE